MKRLVTLFCLTFLYLSPADLKADKNTKVYVKVRNSKVRVEPNYWSKGITSVEYGSALDLISSSSDGWYKVKTSLGREGYIPEASISSKAIALKGSGNLLNPVAGEAEIVIAGKGFSPEVEKSFSRTNPELDFAAVDRVEKLRVSESEVATFIKDGRLKG